MRTPSILALIAVLAAVLLFTSDAPASASSPRGDANCSGITDGRDALDELLVLVGTDVVLPQDCPTLGLQTADGLGGDVNCDGEFDLLDPLTTLKLAGGLPTYPCLALTLSGFGGVGEEIGPDGGTLSTTGLDGTGYTLDIPEGALLGPEVITMTPVDAIADLPVPGGLVAAVDLQPSGLMFWDAVILTIDPANDIPPADQTAFVISEGEFVLHPLVLDSAEIQLPLTHFSAAGVGEGPATGAEPPSSALGQYTAAAAALVQVQRAALLGGGSGDPAFSTKLAELMEDYYDANLAPGLDFPDVGASAAGTSRCLTVAVIVARALGFSSQGQRIGASSFPRLSGALQRLSPHLPGCRQHSFDQCVQFHDVGAISRIIAYTRIMAKLGIPDSPSPLKEMIRKCARFELSFFSWFCVDQVLDELTDPGSKTCDGGISYSFLTPSATFSMPLTPSILPLASVPLTPLLREWNEHFDCVGEMNSTGSDFQVLGGGFSMNTFLTSNPNGEPPVTLVINPGIPDETLHLICDFGADIQNTTLWWQKWCSWHYLELTPPYTDTTALCYGNEYGTEQPEGWGFALTETGWIKVGDDEWRLNFRRTNFDVKSEEDGWESSSVGLWHRPIP
jgi:hypothetical protein